MPKKIPARCSKYCCRVRRNLSKLPEQYVKWPKCHIPGCGGKMIVDAYRRRKGTKDHPPTCYAGCLPYPHRIDSVECVQFEDYKLKQKVLPTSKYNSSPKPEEPVQERKLYLEYRESDSQTVSLEDLETESEQDDKEYEDMEWS